MPNEADRKRELVKAVKALGGHARRIEDSWAVGVLDLIIKLPWVPFIFGRRQDHPWQPVRAHASPVR